MERIICLIFFITLSFLTGGYAQLTEVERKLGFSQQEAGEWIYSLTGVIRDVQKDFSDIASHRTTFAEKKSIVNRTIENNFYSEFSSVQVTSFRRRNPRTFKIRYYLQRLGNLSIDNYEEVELYFDKEYLKLGTINAIGNGKFEFLISMNQVFKAKKKEGVTYKDLTKKNFRFIFYEEDGYWIFLIEDILAKEPQVIKENEINKISRQWNWKD